MKFEIDARPCGLQGKTRPIAARVLEREQREQAARVFLHACPVMYKKSAIKTNISDWTDPKVHLVQAWRIEFSYRNIEVFLKYSWLGTRRAELVLSAERISKTRRYFNTKNSILHPCWVWADE
jgi:hypothetical protein